MKLLIFSVSQARKGLTIEGGMEAPSVHLNFQVNFQVDAWSPPA